MDVMELIVDALRNAGIGCEPNGDVIFVDGGDGKNYSLTVEECEGEDDDKGDDEDAAFLDPEDFEKNGHPTED